MLCGLPKLSKISALTRSWSLISAPAGRLAPTDIVVVGDDAADTFGNPCVVLDRTTGTLWLFVIRTRGADKESAIIAGKSASLPRPFVLSSQDDGHTWSAPRDLTTSIKRDDAARPPRRAGG